MVMEDTAVEPLEQVPERQIGEEARDEAAAPPPSLEFTDAVSAAQWMKTLPLSNVAQAYAALLGQLRALTEADIGPRDRATLAELARSVLEELVPSSY